MVGHGEKNPAIPPDHRGAMPSAKHRFSSPVFHSLIYGYRSNPPRKIQNRSNLSLYIYIYKVFTKSLSFLGLLQPSTPAAGTWVDIIALLIHRIKDTFFVPIKCHMFAVFAYSCYIYRHIYIYIHVYTICTIYTCIHSIYTYVYNIYIYLYYIYISVYNIYIYDYAICLLYPKLYLYDSYHIHLLRPHRVAGAAPSEPCGCGGGGPACSWSAGVAGERRDVMDWSCGGFMVDLWWISLDTYLWMKDHS